MMGEQLKPCPFCGGDAELQKSLGGPFTEDATRVSFRVACKDLECQGGYSNFWHTTPEDAMAAWNRRAERTCHYVYDEMACGWVCSEFGGLEPVGDNVRYCPDCGARAVDQ